MKGTDDEALSTKPWLVSYGEPLRNLTASPDVCS